MKPTVIIICVMTLLWSLSVSITVLFLTSVYVNLHPRTVKIMKVVMKQLMVLVNQNIGVTSLLIIMKMTFYFLKLSTLNLYLRSVNYDQEIRNICELHWSRVYAITISPQLFFAPFFTCVQFLDNKEVGQYMSTYWWLGQYDNRQPFCIFIFWCVDKVIKSNIFNKTTLLT